MSSLLRGKLSITTPFATTFMSAFEEPGGAPPLWKVSDVVVVEGTKSMSAAFTNTLAFKLSNLSSIVCMAVA